MAAIWPKADWLPRPLRLKTAMENLSRSPAEAYANTVSTCRSAVRRSLLRRDFSATLRDYRPEQSIIDAFEVGHRDPLSGMLSADTNVLLPDDFLTKVDRASMGFGLEVRPPLIDWEPMSWRASMLDVRRFKMAPRSGFSNCSNRDCRKDLVNDVSKVSNCPSMPGCAGPLREQVRVHVLNSNSLLAQYIKSMRLV